MGPEPVWFIHVQEVQIWFPQLNKLTLQIPCTNVSLKFPYETVVALVQNTKKGTVALVCFFLFFFASGNAFCLMK